MSKIAVVLICLAEFFTIVAISTNYWGELGDTYKGGTYKGKRISTFGHGHHEINN